MLLGKKEIKQKEAGSTQELHVQSAFYAAYKILIALSNDSNSFLLSSLQPFWKEDFVTKNSEKVTLKMSQGHNIVLNALLLGVLIFLAAKR